MKLSDIRYTMERYIQSELDNDDIINWSNDAQSELMLSLDIPAKTSIAVDTSSLTYPVPAMDIKRINRLWLQSEHEQGVDRDISLPYRIYDGYITFAHRFGQKDVLNVDYYRHLTYFKDINDSIDIEDRYSTLYSSYGLAQYYELPNTIERVGDQMAKRQYDKHYGRHLMIKEQVAAQFTMNLQPSTIKEVY